MLLDKFNTVLDGKFDSIEFEDLKRSLDTIDELSDFAERIQNLKSELPISPQDRMSAYFCTKKSFFSDEFVDILQ